MSWSEVIVRNGAKSHATIYDTCLVVPSKELVVEYQSKSRVLPSIDGSDLIYLGGYRVDVPDHFIVLVEIDGTSNILATP